MKSASPERRNAIRNLSSTERTRLAMAKIQGVTAYTEDWEIFNLLFPDKRLLMETLPPELHDAIGYVFQPDDILRFLSTNDSNNPDVLISLILLCQFYEKRAPFLKQKREHIRKCDNVTRDWDISVVQYILYFHNQTISYQNSVIQRLGLQTFCARQAPWDSLEKFEALRVQIERIRAPKTLRSCKWTHVNPQDLSSEENYFLGSEASVLSWQSSTPSDSFNIDLCAHDNNLSKAHALKHLKQAAEKGHPLALSELKKRLYNSTELTFEDLVGDLPSSQKEHANLSPAYGPDSKHSSQPLGLGNDSESKHDFSEELQQRCDKEIETCEMRAEHLTNYGWNKVNYRMQQSLDYFEKRSKETRTGWLRLFGYSKADEDIRYKILCNLGRWKTKVEQSLNEKEFNVNISKFMQCITDSIPLINRGRSKRFATILQNMKDEMTDLQLAKELSIGLRTCSKSIK
jgi:hypothetical protein